MTDKRNPHDAPPPKLPQGSGRLTYVQGSATLFSGPLPHPDWLAAYDAIIPQGAERIMAMAEEQQKHRHAMELAALDGNLRLARRGQLMAAITCLGVAGVGTYPIVVGKDISGLIALLTPLAALAGTFVFGRRGEAKERREKRGEMEAERLRSAGS